MKKAILFASLFFASSMVCAQQIIPFPKVNKREVEKPVPVSAEDSCAQHDLRHLRTCSPNNNQTVADAMFSKVVICISDKKSYLMLNTGEAYQGPYEAGVTAKNAGGVEYTMNVEDKMLIALDVVTGGNPRYPQAAILTLKFEKANTEVSSSYTCVR